jgi:hypothetical protein
MPFEVDFSKRVFDYDNDTKFCEVRQTPLHYFNCESVRSVNTQPSFDAPTNIPHNIKTIDINVSAETNKSSKEIAGDVLRPDVTLHETRPTTQCKTNPSSSFDTPVAPQHIQTTRNYPISSYNTNNSGPVYTVETLSDIDYMRLLPLRSNIVMSIDGRASIPQHATAVDLPILKERRRR